MTVLDVMLETEYVRANKDIEAAVNRGLATLLLDGVRAAAMAMREEGVPLQVCARVLANPSQRRKSSWLPAIRR